MPAGPAPLNPGTILAERFELREPLGRGGFAIAYLARDLQRQDRCVVKELAPLGATRRPDGVLDLEPLGPGMAQRLRQRFLDEARLLQKLNIEGILPVRAWFGDYGTAFYATPEVQGARTLEHILQGQGRLDPDGAMDMIYQLLEILEAVHERGVLHRDVKPSNVLVAPDGKSYLIDFGAAREWHADSTTHHTVLYTPGYAPLEQLSERARRGPATDIYALCATAYHMLAGEPPPSAAERAAGVQLTPVDEMRSDIDWGMSAGISAGLALRYNDRPPSVPALRHIMAQGIGVPAAGSLEELDEKALALKRFTFDRRACPSCGGLLQEPRPLAKRGCPVCREGTVRARKVFDRLCPLCRSGTLMRRQNAAPLSFCPLCRLGELSIKRKGLLGKAFAIACKACGESFEADAQSMTLLKDGQPTVARSFEEWRAESGRSREVWVCDGCRAQFDELSDGRRRQMSPPPTAYRAYRPEEWARIAFRLDPMAGNAECDRCGADFELDDGRLCLLNAGEDPYGFAKRYRGRLLTTDDARWLGVNKESPKLGLVCDDCGTEFDHDPPFLRLVRTEHPRLIPRIDEPRSLEDWHRIARGLPEVQGEDEFFESLQLAVRQAYREGKIGFEGGDHWRGPASRLNEGGEAKLSINDREVTFGGLIRKWRIPTETIVRAEGEGDRLALHVSGEREPVEFDLDPVELTVHLSAGPQSTLLSAEDLAQRLNAKAGTPLSV